MNKKVLFIGGSSYSGSTMLDMMLSNAPLGFSIGEVQALFRPYRPHHFHPKCGCGDENCQIWKKIREKGEGALYQTVFSQFENVNYIVDSSKNPHWIKKQTDHLVRQGYDVYNILIWKEPADFCASMRKRNRKGCIKAWKNYYRLYMSLIDNWISVSYTELAHNPSSTLTSLCKKLGIRYQSEMEDYWKKQHHTLFGNDSAKVHLFNTSSELTIEDKVYSSVDTDRNSIKKKHRSIYYSKDTDNISEDLIYKIKTDPLIVDILNTIPSGTLRNSDSTRKMIYSKYELVTIAIKENIKRYLGFIIGRYYRFA